MTLQAGTLDREISLEALTETQDAGTGEPVLTPVGMTVWASWAPTTGAGRGDERFIAQQQRAAYIEGAFTTYDLSPRPAPGSHQIVFEGRTYDIQAVIEIGRGEGIELWVSARGE